MNIINLTPHGLEIYNEDGELVLSLPPSGQVARVSVSKKRTGEINHIPLFETVAGDITGLPDVQNGVILVVSGFVRAAVQREDLYQPGELLRDGDGRVVGCVGLSQ